MAAEGDHNALRRDRTTWSSLSCTTTSHR